MKKFPVLLWLRSQTRPKKTAIYTALVVVPTLLIVLVYGILTHESTDDAFVAGHIHPISSRITGTVEEVLVNDNQVVKEGDVLVKLDPHDYQVSYDIAKANYERAAADMIRWGKQTHFAPDVQIIYNAAVDQEAVTKAQLRQAELNLSYTEIRAPASGRIGKKSVETGQLILPSLPILALAEEGVWVVANFKESQLAHMKQGQVAEIDVDSIPGHHFRGRIDSLAPATGASFALLPPDNATGNFTKIVQRVPVKLVFDGDSVRGFEDIIGQGMSVYVRIKTL